MRPLLKSQSEIQNQLTALRMEIRKLLNSQGDNQGLAVKDWFVLIFLLVLHVVALNWMAGHR